MNNQLVAMLAGGLQGYANYKNEQRIREEQRAARQEQIELQRRMLAMQRDQAEWSREFAQEQMRNTNEQERLRREAEAAARGEGFAHEEKMLMMQIGAAGRRGGGGGGGRGGGGGGGGGGGEFASYADLQRAQDAYSLGIIKSLSGMGLSPEEFEGLYSQRMLEWSMYHGLIDPGQTNRPDASPPQLPAGFVPTGDPVTDKYSLAEALREEQRERQRAAVRQNRESRASQSRSMSRSLASGAATPADVQRDFDEGRIDFEQYQTLMDEHYRAQAENRRWKAMRGMTR
jgi:hypothetical protein